MTRQSKKQIQNQAQAEYMQSNESQITGRETGVWKMTKQFKKKQFKQLKNQSQSGRSMIEMLGVLAIIAVLSIGGIVGYKLAMNHYQASQIAHEMNMMRTDAQIKIAQGTEKLTLGSPYDEHKINFNGYDTAFGCKYVDEDDFISEQTVSCQIANAYFIELPKIPDGVCQPLARLINGMDNLIAFSVNDAEYEEGGTCREGENDLYAVFSGETVSDLTHCESGDDCKELESTPVCDLSRHVCVECIQKEDCTQGDGGICLENKCNYCADGEVRDELSKCVECKTNDDCLKKGTDKPICNEENKCEPCPEGEAWNDEFEECVVTSCQENSDCNINGKTGFYCYLDFGYSCEQEFNSTKGFGVGKDGYKSSCRKAEKDAREGETSHYVISTVGMDWWSAWRFCDALGRNHATRESINCGSKVDGDFFCTSDIMNKLVADFSRAGWLDKDEGTCRVYAPSFDYGKVFPYSPEKHAIGSGQALCQPK